MVVCEYFNGRSIDRYYIGFASKEIFIMLHLTSFTISLTPVLKLLTPTKISYFFSYLKPNCRTVKTGDRCSSLKSLNSKVVINDRCAFVEGSWNLKEVSSKISKGEANFQNFLVILACF